MKSRKNWFIRSLKAEGKSFGFSSKRANEIHYPKERARIHNKDLFRKQRKYQHYFVDGIFFRWIRKVRLVRIIIVIISFFKPWKSTRGFLPLFMFFFCFSFDVIKSERLSWIPLNICFRFKNKIFKPQLLLRREFIDFMLLYLNSLYEVNERWCLRCIRVHYANGSELQFLFLQKHLVVLL